MQAMDEIRRDLQEVLGAKIGKGKILLLIGPRQVGKTTLLKSMFPGGTDKGSVQYWNCDEGDVRAMLSPASSVKLKPLVGKSKFIIIDEAQRVKDIGLADAKAGDRFHRRARRQLPGI